MRGQPWQQSGGAEGRELRSDLCGHRFLEALADAGMGWAIWDWKAGFRYWDDRRAEPVEGMRDAFFGDAGK